MKEDDRSSKKLALLVVDVQNGWLDISEGIRRSMDLHLATIQESVGLFRAAGRPVVFTYHKMDELKFSPGNREYDLIPQLNVEGEDRCTVKTRMNSFNGTDLSATLRDLDCDGVLIVGLSALHCVMATYYGAYDQGFHPYLLRGGIVGPEEESVEMAEKVCGTFTMEELREYLHGPTAIGR